MKILWRMNPLGRGKKRTNGARLAVWRSPSRACIGVGEWERRRRRAMLRLHSPPWQAARKGETLFTWKTCKSRHHPEAGSRSTMHFRPPYPRFFFSFCKPKSRANRTTMPRGSTSFRSASNPAFQPKCLETKSDHLKS
jgi:hypothetical protein